MSKFDELKKWIVVNGGYVHDGIGIDESNPGNRILVAKEPLDDIKIISIPKHLCLFKSDDVIHIPPEFKKFEFLIHLIYLLKKEFDLDTKSFYYPFLSFLPGIEEFKNHPIYVAFHEPEKILEWKKICNNCDLINIRLTTMKLIKLFFDKILRIEISKEDFLYYYLLVITRTWADIGFVPFADLFQSRQSSMMFLDKDEEGNHILSTKRKYDTNDVIWINYGTYDEMLIYLNFGFIDDIENKESVHRSMHINLHQTIKQEGELKIFIENNLKGYKSNLNFLSTFGLSKKIFEYLRIFHLTPKEYESISEKSKQTYMTSIISIENELKLFKTIFSILFSSEFPSREMIQMSNEILLQSKDRSNVEYHLAKLTVYQKEIFKTTFSYLMKSWMEIINIPSEISIIFQNHHLLDD